MNMVALVSETIKRLSIVLEKLQIVAVQKLAIKLAIFTASGAEAADDEEYGHPPGPVRYRATVLPNPFYPHRCQR